MTSSVRNDKEYHLGRKKIILKENQDLYKEIQNTR